MSFKNLEQRFNASVNKLYSGAKLKFEDGRPASGPFNDPILVREPGDGQAGIKTEGRSLPFVSAPRDLKRLTLFQISKSGIMFLLKQQLLQTGNTFEQTRLINPAFVIGNAIPFLHVRRHLRPISELFSSTDRSYTNVKKLGQLQRTTYDTAGKEPERGIGKFLKSLVSPVTNTVSAFTAKRNVGEELTWEQSRPELGEAGDGSEYIVSISNKTGRLFRFGGEVTYVTKFGVGEGEAVYRTYTDLTDGEKKWTHVDLGYVTYENSEFSPLAVTFGLSERANESSLQTKYDQSIVQEKIDIQNPIYDNIENDIRKFLAYFDADDESIRASSQAKFSTGTSGGTINAKELARETRDPSTGKSLRKISYIRDPSNLLETNRKQTSLFKSPVTLDPAYRELTGMGNTPEEKNFDDPIVVSFAMGNNSHVQFRAYITGLQQTATPDYTPLQYIGRVEKFINFKGIQREISFKLGVIAFSKDEIDIVWKRINYLTGLVFPYGFNRGILQPNIIRLTIGNIYVNQPGYITSLNTDFSGMSETWDLDRQVTIGALMDIKFVLIEKATKIASSPFYGITGDVLPETIPTNSPVTNPSQPQTEPPVSTTGEAAKVDVEERIPEAIVPKNLPLPPTSLEELERRDELEAALAVINRNR